MKKNLLILGLITLTTSVCATELSDFVGNYELASGSANCDESFKVSSYMKNGGECLSIKRNSPGMQWSRTDKVCNVDQATALEVNDIPAPIYIGTITHSDFAALNGAKLYHSHVQLTEYTNGGVLRQQEESSLSLDDAGNLEYKLTSIDADGVQTTEFTQSNCTYVRQ